MQLAKRFTVKTKRSPRNTVTSRRWIARHLLFAEHLTAERLTMAKVQHRHSISTAGQRQCQSLITKDWAFPHPKPGKRRSSDGLVPANQTYGQWLFDQSKEVKDDVLGASKVPYFNMLSRKYGPSVAIRRFVRQDGSEVTLQELQARYPLGKRSEAFPHGSREQPARVYIY